MHDDASLRLRLALAREAGDAAAWAMRRIATRNSEPDDRSTLGGRVDRVWRPGPAVTASQIRDACRALDEFTASIVDVDRLLDERRAPGNLAATLDGTAVDLWESTDTAAGVYERVTDALANLERVRIALVLGRPLTRPLASERA